MDDVEVTTDGGDGGGDDGDGDGGEFGSVRVRARVLHPPRLCCLGIAHVCCIGIALGKA